MKTFNLPDIGEGLQEAEIISWHVNVGDHVVADQPLVSIETDKAVVDVPSPQAGHIAKMFGSTGDIIQVGEPLLEFEQGEHADSGAIVGEIETQQTTAAPTRPVVRPDQVKVTPAIRALAKKLGVDLNLVQATGPSGVITSTDVERAAKTLSEAAEAEPLRGVRRAMAKRMAHAHREVVPATVTAEADIDSWSNDTNVMLRLIHAVVSGCQAAPALNAWFDGQDISRRLHRHIDLGIAVNTENGLFVPVLRDVGQRDDADLGEGLQRLKTDVKNRTVPAQELRGQTITLSNFGSLFGRFANLVVAPPQVAILGAGQIKPQVVAIANKPVIHSILPLSLTFDHRAVTGGEAAQFLAAAVADLEQPS